MLPAQHRLRDRRDFTGAVRGLRAGNRLVVIHATHSTKRSGLPPRVGLAVSRAVGNAVMRNRVKRILRARLAPVVASMPTGIDMVVRAQPAITGASQDDVGAALTSALRRILGSFGASPAVP